MAKTITVNEAELALIESRRQKEAAEKAELEAQKKVEIARVLENMANDKMKFKAQIERDMLAWNDLFSELQDVHPGAYEMKKEEVTKEFSARLGYKYDDEVVGNDSYTYANISIVYKAQPNVTVRLVFDNGRYKYEISGIHGLWDKKYRRSITVDAKIREHFDAKEAAVAAKQRKVDNLEYAYDKLKIANPDATVEKKMEQQWSYKYGRRGRRIPDKPIDAPRVKVTYPNGLQLIYAVNEQGEPKFYNYDASKLDKEAMMEALKNVPAKENA